MILNIIFILLKNNNDIINVKNLLYILYINRYYIIKYHDT